jgi:hypothetical protein
MNREYLSLLGIVTWFPKVANNYPALYYFQLLRRKEAVGYLILNRAGEQEEDHKADRLIENILKSVDLERLLPGKRLFAGFEANLAKRSINIAVGELATRFIKQLPDIKGITCPDVEQIFSSPHCKGEVWATIKCLARQFE